VTSASISRKSIDDSMKELKHLTELTKSHLLENDDLKSFSNTNTNTTTIEIMNNEFFLQFAKEFALTSQILNIRSN